MSRRRVEVAPGVTYREWVNERRELPCVCKADCISANLNAAHGRLSFRFGLNFTRDQLAAFGPQKAALMFALVAHLHNNLREVAGERDGAPITAEGLAEMVMAEKGPIQ